MWPTAQALASSDASKLTPCNLQGQKHIQARLGRKAALCHAAATAKQSTSQTKQDSFEYMQVKLPPPNNSRVKKAEYIKSSTRVVDCPPDKYPEFAVIGRSNVGKSSLINCLTETDKLAKVSKEPGMTKLINHFLLNDSWYLVDLPGYGFAKAAKDSKQEWLDFTKDYFISRENLVHVLLLIDSSIPPQPVDIECANWLADCEVPFCFVFTKLDVRKKDMPTNAQNIRAFKQILADEWEALPLCFETSSNAGLGKSELLGYLASLRQLHRGGK